MEAMHEAMVDVIKDIIIDEMNLELMDDEVEEVMKLYSDEYYGATTFEEQAVEAIKHSDLRREIVRITKEWNEE